MGHSNFPNSLFSHLFGDRMCLLSGEGLGGGAGRVVVSPSPPPSSESLRALLTFLAKYAILSLISCLTSSRTSYSVEINFGSED